MTWLIVYVRSTPKTILNCHNRSGRVSSVTNIRNDIDVIDHKGVVYVENDTELLWSIRLGADCDEN